MNKWKIVFFIVLLSVFSCIAFMYASSYRYNKMIEWSDNIPQGTSIDSVKKITPSYIVVDWENPNGMTNEKSYIIKKIKWSYDPLHMSNYLAFKDNKYIARFAHK